MAYYSILAISPTSGDWVPQYLEVANRLVPKHGGNILARTASHEQLEGPESKSSLRAIIEWPSAEAAKAFMADPEYVPHLDARTAGSVSHHFLVEGKDDLA